MTTQMAIPHGISITHLEALTKRGLNPKTIKAAQLYTEIKGRGPMGADR